VHELILSGVRAIWITDRQPRTVKIFIELNHRVLVPEPHYTRHWTWGQPITAKKAWITIFGATPLLLPVLRYLPFRPTWDSVARYLASHTRWSVCPSVCLLVPLSFLVFMPVGLYLTNERNAREVMVPVGLIFCSQTVKVESFYLSLISCYNSKKWLKSV